MTVQQLEDTLVGEVLEVLQGAETLAARPGTSRAPSLVDSIMQVRARLIQAHPDAGVYSAALFRAVLENAVDAIVIIDDCGVITTVNPAAERMFGYSAEELIGQEVKMLMPSPYNDEHDDHIARYLRTGEARVIGLGRDVTGRRKDGSTFPVHLALSHVRIGGRDVFAGFLRDTSSPGAPGGE